MNAIAAVIGSADQQAARAVVTSMLDRMSARGAGHRMVVGEATAVLAASGRSPSYSSKPGKAFLAGDIRLANHADLRTALDLPATAGDAAIATEAFAAWADAFAERLVGDFAIVLFDRPNGRLIAVRDALGVRPLFYRQGTSHVRVASELRALVEPADSPDEGFLAEAMAGTIVDAEATPYASVRRVPPAHMLIATVDAVRIVRYWSPPREPVEISVEAQAERLRTVFDEAVRAACEGSNRVGVDLSGGLGSACVLGSIVDHRFAEPIAVEPSIETRTEEDDNRDLPYRSEQYISLAALHDAMRNDGVDAVLTGVGVDYWEAGGQGPVATWRGRVGHRLSAVVPQRLRSAARKLVPERSPEWIDRRFAARVHLADRLRRRPQAGAGPSEVWDRLAAKLASGEGALANERLDRLAIASGVELRHPFLNRRVVELALSIAAGMPDTGESARDFLRDAMRDRIAPEIYARAAAADSTAALLRAAGLREVPADVETPMLTKLGWIHARGLENLAERARHGDAGAAAAFWRVAGVEAWLKEVFGSR